MKLIGIGHRKQTGKDTVAKIISILSSDLYYTTPEIIRTMENWESVFWAYEQRYKIRKFADNLKEIMGVIFNLPEGSYFDSLKDDYLPPNWASNMTYREAIQFIGTDLLRNQFNKDIWVNSLFEQYHEGDSWIVSDVRFPNEVQAIKDRGGLLIRVDRSTSLIDEHESESSLDSFDDWDFVIPNHGSVEKLIGGVKILCEELNIC